MFLHYSQPSGCLSLPNTLRISAETCNRGYLVFLNFPGTTCFCWSFRYFLRCFSFDSPAISKLFSNKFAVIDQVPNVTTRTSNDFRGLFYRHPIFVYRAHAFIMCCRVNGSKSSFFLGFNVSLCGWVEKEAYELLGKTE